MTDASAARRELLERFAPAFHEVFQDVEPGTTTADFEKLVPQTPYIIYVHIPFCDAICRDCPYSRTMDLKHIETYCEHLIREIELLGGHKIKKRARPTAIYFGGGTPSLLPFNTLARIMEKLKQYFILDANPEVTFEVHPNSFDLGKLDAYRKLGLNRISIGVQSFHDAVLEEMGRGYAGDFVKNIVKEVAKAGWNFNIDLMYGFDSQTPQMFFDDLDYAIQQGVSHVAIYNLIRNMSPEQKEFEYAKQAKTYYAARDKLRQAGYIQYVVNEFARDKRSTCKYAEGKVKLPIKENMLSVSAATAAPRRTGRTRSSGAGMST